MDSKNQNNDFFFSLSDFCQLCKREKSKIFFSAAFFAILAAFYTLTNPFEYVAEGSFKEKGKSSSGIAYSLTAALFSGANGASDNEGISLMKSRFLMEKLVKKMGLQASIAKKESHFELLQRIRDNFKIEYAYLRKRVVPVFADSKPILEVSDIVYDDEIPLGLTIKFISDQKFEVIGASNRILGQGEIGIPFSYEKISFTINQKIPANLAYQKWELNFSPLKSIAELLAKKIIIETDRLDKTLLIIKYQDGNRAKATELVNNLMLLYQEYLQNEQDRIAEKQIAYLEKREKEIGDNLKKMMIEHANSLSSDLSDSGFSDSSSAMEFLADNLNYFKHKLLEIDLEVKRLQTAQKEGYAYYDVFTSKGDSSVINQHLSEIRSLKQHADSLDLALRMTPIDENLQRTIFIQQIQELEEIRHYNEEAKSLLASLNAGDIPNRPERLLKTPKYMVKTWYDRLIELQNQLNASASSLEEKKGEQAIYQANFITYLLNLIHLFNVHEKTIQEQLVHQQSQQKEFQGIELDTARELYMSYSKQLNELEALSLQHQFIVDQMQTPEFEISSLSTILNDSVANHMITKASNISLSLKDQNNRSVKEQQRLKDELELEKEFLTLHLKQTIQLLGLKQNLVKDKIKTLQSVTLGLIQEKISILEKQLSDYISTRFKDLKQERLIIEQHQKELKKEMASLPNKWVAEKLIEQQMETNQKMVEEVSRLVESKNITSNLETIQSAPRDKAIPPLHPKSPRLLFHIILGSIMGAIFSVTFLVLQSAVKGFRASESNLSLAGQHVSGAFSLVRKNSGKEDILDSDLETLRRITAFLCSGERASAGGQSVLLISGAGFDFSRLLADLMSKKGLKILRLPISFDHAEDLRGHFGLLQYLQNEASEPGIEHLHNYDEIIEGGISRYSNELLGSANFNKLMQKLLQQYDWIIAVSHAMPATAQAEGLVSLFDHAVINVSEENLTDLRFYMDLASSKPNKKISFVISETNI